MFEDQPAQLWNSSHHHYLHLVSGVGDEEICCDLCNKCIEEGGMAWHCTIPYCNFDQCLSCAAVQGTVSPQSSSAGDEATTDDVIDNQPPLFLVSSLVSLKDQEVIYRVTSLEWMIAPSTASSTVDTVFNTSTTSSTVSLPQSHGFWHYTIEKGDDSLTQCTVPEESLCRS